MLGNGFVGDGGDAAITRAGAGGVKRGKLEQQRLSSPTPSVAKDLGCTASSRFPGGLTAYENDMRRLLTAVGCVSRQRVWPSASEHLTSEFFRYFKEK